MTSVPNLYLGRQTWLEALDAAALISAFEIAARALIVHEDKTLLVYEADTDCWFTAGGRLKPGEDLRAAALREIDEETGLACTLGDVVATFDVLMPRQGYTTHKFEYIFHATPKTAPDWTERPHIDSDQSGPVVSKLRWFTADEAAALPLVFPEALRHWPSLIKRGPA